ncbi:hypothetical protein LT330_009239 [Penicillium expansum]|nr:hypothetical protein LT330_009239 [Penicillium expansum]
MWSDNSSVAGASKDLPNGEILTDSSPKPVPTAFAARSDSPRRFRFVKGAPRPKKRRRINSPKEQASRAVVTENSAVTPEVVLRTTTQNLEIFDDHQRDNSLASLELQEGHFFDDFSLFDSILPNIFASTPFLDIEPQETLASEVLPGLMETSRMTPLSPADRPIEPVLQNLQTSSNIDPLFREEAEQSVLGDLVPRTIQEPTIPYASARLQAVPMISEISSSDHEKLLELLYPLRYRELVNSPHAGTLSAPNPWRPKRIDDTSHSVTSRNANLSPIMDQTYLDFLVRWEEQDEWSFFDLTGCPRELLVHLFELAELAKQCEIALSMKWLTFDMTPIKRIENELIGWKNDADSPLSGNNSKLTEEDAIKQLDEQQDRYHCAEAWRHALLLYLEYIFKCDRKRRSISVNRLVRKTIDHIRCCRRTSQTQKQLLIPVFLAGSETSDEDMRHFVKEYCAYWGEKSRYSMFNSVPVLFDEIWASGKWWGAVIDSKTRPSSGHGQGTTQLLFG